MYISLINRHKVIVNLSSNINNYYITKNIITKLKVQTFFYIFIKHTLKTTQYPHLKIQYNIQNILLLSLNTYIQPFYISNIYIHNLLFYFIVKSSVLSIAGSGKVTYYSRQELIPSVGKVESFTT